LETASERRARILRQRTVGRGALVARSTELRLTCAKDTHSRQRRLYRVKMFHPRIFDVI
jgi:hypothetical protein